MIKGIKEVTVGYAGGTKENPSYEEVSSGRTGHAEVVQITFDPAVVSYETLLEVFWSVHDPTQLNRQGADIGTQYRSIILYETDEQKDIAERSKRELEKSGLYKGPIRTEVIPLEKFWPAEDYHQRYFEKNPNKAYCQIVINPKVEKFAQLYDALIS